jgi:hypothetical protein
MHNPSLDHFHAVKRIIRDIKGTLHQFGLSLTQSIFFNYELLLAYFDVDWAGCPHTTRRSIYGLTIFFGDNLVS